MNAVSETQRVIRAAVVAWPGADLPALLDANEAVVVCCAHPAGGRSAADALVRTILCDALGDPDGSAGAWDSIPPTTVGLRESVLPDVHHQHARHRPHVHPNVPFRVTTTILAETDIARAPGGKPYLATRGRPLNFNVSHSGDALLVALSRTANVGVDVERVRAIPEWRAIAMRMFDAVVRQRLVGEVACGADEDEAFIRCWCRHEASVKATGEGLFPSDTRDDANDCSADRARPRVIDLPELPLPAAAGRYRGALALQQ